LIKEIMAKDYRRCVSCRQLALKSEFWRVVRSHPDHQVVIYLGGTWVEGRSAYLCRSIDCLQLAQKKNRLGRSIKAKVSEDIYQKLGLLLAAL
jgi:uncharacterized protein